MPYIIKKREYLTQSYNVTCVYDSHSNYIRLAKRGGGVDKSNQPIME